MEMKNRKKIAVLFGGCSSEYEVSLQSAYAVITHIDTEQYELVLIGITKTGKWYLYQGDPVNILGDSWYNEEECIPAVVSPDKELHGILLMKGRETEEISLDGALPILHGRNGEDGTVQGALELAEIPVIGCGTMSSAVCMDKEMAHRLAGEQGVKVPRSYTIPREDLNLMDIKIKGRELGYPLFVKPLRAGSSFGITRVEKAEDLRLAVEHAFEYDSSVILEEMIAGFEVGCAVLGTKELMTGAVDEIELSEGFFDYTEKYTLKTSKIHVPARISPEKAKEIQETAKIIYRGLGCNYFARVDMFLTPSGEIYFNEVNTIPGFTSHSRYPNMMKAAGVSFEELLSRLLELSGRD
jgi:D-alanine---D-serine ligase